MKRVAIGLCALLTVTGMLVGTQLFSQETKPATKAEAKKSEAKKEAKGRLPNNYAKLELTETQVTSIYGIQSKYGAEIAALQAQLDALKAKQSNEVKGVLTPVQTAKLAEIEADAAKKKADLKKAELDAKADAAKALAPKTEPAKTETPRKVEVKGTEKK